MCVPNGTNELNVTKSQRDPQAHIYVHDTNTARVTEWRLGRFGFRAVQQTSI